MRARTLVLQLIAAVAVLSAPANPPPCDPTPIRKDVRVVRREIVVSIIGEERPWTLDDSKRTLEGCWRYWKAAMDKEVVNRPDLVVLPECIDSDWAGATGAAKRRWIETVRGDGLLTRFQAYAKEHGCYLVFNSYRQRTDGRFANCSYAIDRAGDVIACYDKVYPTPGEIENADFPVVPGPGPVVVETDFGRLGFATCFDLNFRDLIEAYAKEKPDVICFCSAYNGDFWQRVWSYTCRAHLIAATSGALAKDVVGPSGEQLYHLHDYFRTCTVTINTNCRVCHLDDNWTNLRRAEAKYGRRIEVRKSGAVGTVTVLSHDPSLPVDDVIREFGLILWDDYYARSVRLRGGPLKGEGKETCR